jgi:hypothetical protein
MRWKQVAVWILIVVPWVAAVVLACRIWSSPFSPWGEPGAIVVLYSFGSGVAAALFVFLYPPITLSGWWLVRQQHGRRRMGLAVAAVGVTFIGGGVLALGAKTFFVGMGSPLETARLRTRDGRVYRVHRLGMSYVEVLTEEIARSRFSFRVRVLGVADHEYCNLLIVRPEGEYDLPASGVGIPMPLRLVMSRDGRWVALLRSFTTYPTEKVGCTTELAYDTEGKRCYSGDITGTLDDLSPFFLVGPHDTPDAQDAAAMLYAVKHGPQYAHTSENVSVLARDARHPNPQVRALAAVLLASSDKDGIPVLERLISDPDPSVRQAAAGALRKLKLLVQDTR